MKGRSCDSNENHFLYHIYKRSIISNLKQNFILHSGENKLNVYNVLCILRYFDLFRTFQLIDLYSDF